MKHNQNELLYQTNAITGITPHQAIINLKHKKMLNEQTDYSNYFGDPDVLTLITYRNQAATNDFNNHLAVYDADTQLKIGTLKATIVALETHQPKKRDPKTYYLYNQAFAADAKQQKLTNQSSAQTSTKSEQLSLFDLLPTILEKSIMKSKP